MKINEILPSRDLTRNSHAKQPRGLTATAAQQTKPGMFARMFPALQPATFAGSESENIAALTKLGEAITADFDAPKDGFDSEESGIPALYTYFGQFIDHDLTFDPVSLLGKRQDPDGLVDFRTPSFDLDNLYGRGPSDQPYLYDGGSGNGNQFLLGGFLSGGDMAARDLLRNCAVPSRAIIGDPRNDENVIVSQFQGLALRFHNHWVRDHSTESFDQVATKVRHHYQYVVINDFLPRIVSAEVLAQLKGADGGYDRSKLKFYNPGSTIIGGKPFSQAFMPVEFSAACYRLGHSMVRPGYRLNDHILLPIFPVPGFPAGLSSFNHMPQDWGIDWGRFIDIDLRPSGGTDTAPGPVQDQLRRLQFAYRIDSSTVNPLGNLPQSVFGSGSASLAVRNLVRGWSLGLPSGQVVAKAMDATVLGDDKLQIGKQGDKNPTVATLIADGTIDKTFAGNLPLWAYILSEAMHHVAKVVTPVAENQDGKTPITTDTPRLGPVGGRIVAETFLGILFADPTSLLGANPAFVPEPIIKRHGKSGYALADFVKYALT